MEAEVKTDGAVAWMLYAFLLVMAAVFPAAIAFTGVALCGARFGDSAVFNSDAALIAGLVAAVGGVLLLDIPLRRLGFPLSKLRSSRVAKSEPRQPNV
jgi:hypothetical protein